MSGIKTKLTLSIGVLFLILQTSAQTVTDIDGNTYATITHGTQQWMQENLKTSRFNNGDLIPTTVNAINNDSTSIDQWPYNNDALNTAIYGRLYTWYAVKDARNTCPGGWHVPSETEWTTLANYLGGDTVAGNKMKETGTSHWASTSSAVTNSSNFTALPGGFRGNPSGFSNLKNMANFWSTTPFGISAFQRAITYRLKADSKALEQSVAVANCGMSVRCIKDVATKIENTVPENKIRIYPNPVKDMLYFKFEKPGNYTLSLFDSQGTLVLKTDLTENTNTLHLKQLSKGIYLLKVDGLNTTFEQRIVID